jgi:dTMP kinase
MKDSRFYGHGLPYKKPGNLKGSLIVIEGTDHVGRSTQIEQLKPWLEVEGYGVVSTRWTRSALLYETISDAKAGNRLNASTFALLYAADFADRLENEIIPALRAGFVVLIDRYIFSIMARAIARGEDRRWIEQVTGFGLAPHAVYYLRAEVDHLVSRVVLGRGAFDYWESGMDLRFGPDMYESFVKYQTRLIRALDAMVKPYEFTVIDAGQPIERIFRELQRRMSGSRRKGIPRRRVAVKKAKA